ncbi:hypothetical protein [Belnapia rosea]|uniref:Uncharacterized protein n=1 Tax=Belnapia rosea TaxID=938405 RepID=A0A1G6SPW3_9PROT|nr:hypothetical protein [Belnapia rosea]SDD18920.1 hypothetical protein SAMN04487779_1005111 [Belnapia rosea]
MDSDSLVVWLFAMTLIVGAAIGVWQWTRVKQAKRTNEHSVATTPQAGPDPRA